MSSSLSLACLAMACASSAKYSIGHLFAKGASLMAKKARPVIYPDSIRPPPDLPDAQSVRDMVDCRVKPGHDEYGA
jgi:hypothetical protein